MVMLVSTLVMELVETRLEDSLFNILNSIIVFQEWSLTKSGNVKHSDLCLSVTSAIAGERVKLKICDNSGLQVKDIVEIG